MIKLFKYSNNILQYAEIWCNNNITYIHTGVVGEQGTLIKKEGDYNENEKNFIKKYTKLNYTEAKYTQLILTFKLLKVLKSVEKCEFLKEKVINVLNEELGWKGLGHVDGWDFAESKTHYVLNIFCFTVDRKIAKKCINDILLSNKIKNKFIIQER